MSSILTLFLPLLVRILTGFLDKRNASQETKRAFLDFVRSMDKDSLASSSLRKSYYSQLEKLGK